MKNIIIINGSIIKETEIKDLSDLFSNTEKFLFEIDQVKKLRDVNEVMICVGEYIVTYESSFVRWLYPEHATIIRNDSHQILQIGFDDYKSDLYLTEFCIEDCFDEIRYNKYLMQDLIIKALKNIFKRSFEDKMRFDEFLHTDSYGPVWFKFMYADKDADHNNCILSDKIYLEDCSNFALWDEEE